MDLDEELQRIEKEARERVEERAALEARASTSLKPSALEGASGGLSLPAKGGLVLGTLVVSLLLWKFLLSPLLSLLFGIAVLALLVFGLTKLLGSEGEEPPPR